MNWLDKIPFAVMADSYKGGHHMMYPGSDRMTVYGEFRGPLNPNDQRIIAYGIRYIVENILNHQWTEKEVDQAKRFYDKHNVGASPYPWPEKLFRKFIKENNGYFPITVKAMPEGSVIYPHVPVYQIIAEGEYATLATFLETIITHYWYPATVATQSRHVWQQLREAFDRTVDSEFDYLLASRLHDFGYRGTTCNEQALIGGLAHLLNFDGSDTMVAAFYAQEYLNAGNPIACSIPATEHSIMMSHACEQDAVDHALNLFGQYGFGLVATVADTYNYKNFLDKVVPKTWEKFKDRVGLWVVRPDSGDPVKAVIDAAKALEKACGVTINKKGFKVINHGAVIQGDGIGPKDIVRICKATENEKFATQNFAFGMGGGLLQRVNRDTMRFATKLSSIRYITGATRDVMKRPATDSGKYSLPGEFKVVNTNGVPMIFPLDAPGDDMQQVVYDKGPVMIKWPLFSELRAQLNVNWAAAPKTADVISQPLKDKIARLSEELNKISGVVVEKTNSLPEALVPTD